MRISEEVTFGSSGLDRAAHLRGQDARLAQFSAQYTFFWRGKPLMSGSGLSRFDAHALVDAAQNTPLFLGLENGVALFACDVSHLEPDEGDTPDGSFLDLSEQRFAAFGADHRFMDLRQVMTDLSRRDAELAVMARAVFAWHLTHGFCSKCGHASDVTLSGWQRQCPACEAQHFPRTDPVVIMLITKGNKTLLGRSPGWPEGMYSCLAGFMEPGETMEAAVRRETFEETGVRVGDVRYLSSQPWPFPASLMLGAHGETLSEALNIDPNEIENAIWLSREELLDAFAGQHPTVKSPRNGAIAHFLLQNWLADRLD